MKPFAHLHVHTEYSLLDGAAKISKLFAACKQRNMPAVAMTDHGNMYGAVKFVKAAQKYNEQEEKEYKEKVKNGETPPLPFKVKPILGCEFYICEDIHNKSGKPDLAHIVLLAKTQEGYKNLIQMNSIAFIDGFYYKPRIDYKILKEHTKDLICLSGCLAGHVQKFLMQDMYDEAKKKAIQLRDMFAPGDFYIELQNHDIEEQKRIMQSQIELAREIGVPLVVTNDVHYTNKEDAEMQDVMLCIQTGKRVDDPDRLKFATDEFYMKSYDELLEKFSFIEEALDETVKIAERCDASVLFNLPLTPSYHTGTGETPDEMLRRLTFEGLKNRYAEITPKIEERANYELSVIQRLGYAEYFLIVWDFVHYCFKNGIPVGPGRGSAAGSIVSYAMDITKVEPLKYDLFFERFLNPDRISMPDIDLDFCFERRAEVIDYVTKKYGADKVCQIATFGTLAAKAAVKDVGRTLNMPYAEVEKITKAFPVIKIGDKDPLRKIFGMHATGEPSKLFVPELKEIYDNNPSVKKIVDIAVRLEGMPRNVSMHAAGVVICREVVSDFVPLCKSGDSVCTQFDMRELEDIGVLKMDFLGLRTLTDLQRALDMIEKNYGRKIDFYAPDFDYDDKDVYKVIASGNTDAIFQLESGGMKRFMKELRPDNMEDVIAGIAIYRPGPMSMIPRFISGKRDPSTITYAHPTLKPILENTYGCIVYQEQVMRIVQEIAGYSLSQGDGVRKMMGKKLVDKLLKERDTFINGRDDEKHPIPGAIKHSGMPVEVANDLFTQMERFGEYAFNKSHSTVYAYIGYQTAYLKRYYEPEFIASVLNNRITKADEVEKYIAHARERNIKILPPDVNQSDAWFTVENGAVRFGLAALKNVGVGACEALVAERQKGGKFLSFNNFMERLDDKQLNKKFLEALILSGSLDGFGHKRSQLMQTYEEITEKIATDKKNKASGQFSFFDMVGGEKIETEFKFPNIAEYARQTLLKFEKQVSGTYISGHPLESFTDRFSVFNLRSDMLAAITKEPVEQQEDEEETAEVESEVQDGMQVTCGGLVVELKKILTKSNQEMAFIKIEDLYGSFEAMVFSRVFAKVKHQLSTDSMISVKGKVSLREGQPPTVLVEAIEFWESDDTDEAVQQILPIENEDAERQQKLYLKYSMLDEILSTEILNILRSCAGHCEVIIKCTETGEYFKASEKIEITTGLLSQLQSVLPSDSIVVK